VRRAPGDNLGYAAFEEFRKTLPQPRCDPSGKFEIHPRPSPSMSVRSVQRKDPLPKYERVPEGHEETRRRIPAATDYDPLPRRATALLRDNIPQLREAFPTSS
jgi:hypothetical protein